MTKRKKILRIIWNAYMILIVILLGHVIANYSHPYMKDGFDTKECYELSSGWQYIEENGTHIQEVTLPVNIRVPDSTQSVTIEHSLPQYISGGWYLAVPAPLNTVSIYISGKPVMEYHGMDGLLKSRYPASARLFLPLQSSYAGKQLTIVFGSPYPSYRGNIGMIYIGDRTDIIHTMIMQKLPALAGGMLMIAFGITMMVLQFVVKKWIRYRQESTYIGVFVFFTGIWLCLQTGLAQLFFKDISYARFLEFFALMMSPIPVIRTTDRITRYRYQFAARILSVADLISILIVSFSVLVLHMDYLQVNWITLAMISASVLYTYITMVLVYRNDKALFHEVRWLVCAYIFLGFAALLEMSFALASNYMQHGRFMAIGALIYCICIYRWASLQIQGDESRKEMIISKTAAKSDFLANVSHEIRTPVNAIIGTSARMEKEAADPLTRERTAHIAEAAEKLLLLINKILDSSRIDSGRLKLTEENYRTETLLKDLRDLARRYEKNASGEVKTVFRYAPGIPSGLYGDAGRICQIFSCMIENAYHFTEKGAVILSVDAENAEDGMIRLQLEVRDTGSGIDKRDIPTLFHQFRHLSDGTAGTGLGLYIASSLSHMMKGDITVRSTAGIGADFIAEILQKVTDQTPVGEEMQLTEETEDGQQTAQQEDYSDLKVLVVDDEPMNRKIAEEILHDLHVRTELAEDGFAAVQMASDTAYDLILMDYLMPGLDGEAACREIRSDTKHLSADAAIYMLTAEDSEKVRSLAVSGPFNGFLMKPLIPEALQKVLKIIAAGGTGR